ncbi:hypothetical protein [Segetibacter aerophilus]|uniref:Uncharacterized protein n=1 Tax=Segetibacter aerophilus TaxID=670293 RepID=A0A512BD30_9BACT|nr:hypothetical protein [Segetibacter aerophilus]GEO09876.1 hypothetical protein SAE01_23720 [Segetibacter aerophilus]
MILLYFCLALVVSGVFNIIYLNNLSRQHYEEIKNFKGRTASSKEFQKAVDELEEPILLEAC